MKGILPTLATIVVTSLGILFLIFLFAFNGKSLLHIRAKRPLVGWHAVGPTPLAEKRYPPQGLVYCRNKLLIAVHWNDTKCRIYELNPTTLEELRYFDMPDDAVHTGGLSYDEQDLWAVDYATNKAYRLDYEQSFESREASILGSFETSLKGTSACAIVPYEGKTYLAISDFKNSRETILVDVEKAEKSGSALNAIRCRYRNEGFSQGLTYDKGALFEVENKYPQAVVNHYHVADLFAQRDAWRGQYLTPDRGAQDICSYEKGFWLSDAVTFQIYRGDW